MRKMLSGIAVLALATASATAAIGMPAGTMTGGDMMGMPMPKCTSRTGPVVWMDTATKTYHMKGTPKFGMGTGMYVCRKTAVARGGHMAKMGGAMHGGAMHGGAMHGGAMHGGAMHGGAMHGDAMHGGSMSGGRTMPMASPGAMAKPRAMMSPGAMSSSMPMPSGTTMGRPTSAPLGGTSTPPNGNLGNASGGQGNTGAPGAGGQTPNNPASTSNNATPVPRPT
ncbi:MAG: hypothetical protein NVS3B7_00360 [Candidatus Elarobacter sp.]